MHPADLTHPSSNLQEKLTHLYGLRTATPQQETSAQAPKETSKDSGAGGDADGGAHSNQTKNIALGLRRPYLDLLEAYGNPQKALPPTIHVAGTNGKGSMIAILRTLLEAAGQSVSAYTSPHLYEFNERFYANGHYIDNIALEHAIDRALRLNQGQPVSFFEITTAMAFAYFREADSDVCLLEVGMGGRLDCTNVIERPAITLIGNISYDHQEFLGQTIEEIAAEKAGIMKPGVPCIVGPQTEGGVRDVFIRKAKEIGATLMLCGRDWDIKQTEDGLILHIGDIVFDLPPCGLRGAHQVGNAGAALTALYMMKPWQTENPDDARDNAVYAAYKKALPHVEWPGRLQAVHAAADLCDQRAEIWYDGGCNASAGEALAATIDDWNTSDKKPLHLIVGMKADKDPAAFLRPLMKRSQSITIVPISAVDGALTPAQAKTITAEYHQGEDTDKNALQWLDAQTLEEAIKAIDSVAKANADNPENPPGYRVLITGSLYLAQQVRDINNHPLHNKAA